MNPFKIVLHYCYLTNYSQGSLLYPFAFRIFTPLSGDSYKLFLCSSPEYTSVPLNTLQQLEDITIITLRNVALQRNNKEFIPKDVNSGSANFGILQQNILKLVPQPWLNGKRKAKCFHHTLPSPSMSQQLSRLKGGRKIRTMKKCFFSPFMPSF